MSEYLRLIILGIIQGLTEFLPVSSSGHLEIFKLLLGDDSLGQESLTTTVVLHFATALSTIFVFRKDILDLIRSLANRSAKTEHRFIFYILLSMIPAAIVGVFFEDKIEALFFHQMILVGVSLIITAGLLLLADLQQTTERKLNATRSIVVGVAQAIAILPGISRSGATIAGSVLLGVKRSEAARFSFLMVVPLIFGKILLDIKDGAWVSDQINWGSLGLGFAAAFLSGILACRLMIKLVNNSRLRYFAVYCFLVGVSVLLFLRG